MGLCGSVSLKAHCKMDRGAGHILCSINCVHKHIFPYVADFKRWMRKGRAKSGRAGEQIWSFSEEIQSTSEAFAPKPVTSSFREIIRSQMVLKDGQRDHSPSVFSLEEWRSARCRARLVDPIKISSTVIEGSLFSFSPQNWEL